MKTEFKELADAVDKISIELATLKELILALDGHQPPVSELDSFVVNHFTLDESRIKPVFISNLVDYFAKHYCKPVSPKTISHAMSRCGFKSHVVRISNKTFRVYYVISKEKQSGVKPTKLSDVSIIKADIIEGQKTESD